MKIALLILLSLIFCVSASAATWECIDSTDGHVYRVSQDVWSDKCTMISSELTASEKETKNLQEKMLASVRKGMTPFIGMSKLEATYSTWGSPDRVNTSVRASGVTEQWAYKGRGYLYFENNKLVEIQN